MIPPFDYIHVTEDVCRNKNILQTNCADNYNKNIIIKCFDNESVK